MLATPYLVLNKNEASQPFSYVLVSHESMLGGRCIDTKFEFLVTRLLGETKAQS